MGNSIINAYPKVFKQFVRDNVDHNIRILDGSGTFHGIEIILRSTPFPINSVLKECDKISLGKDITPEVSVNKGIAWRNYMHPVKPEDINNLWQAS